MSELLDVGKTCSVCAEVDFLPIPCPHCRATLCNAHIQPQHHFCSAAATNPPPATFPNKLHRCAFETCNNLSLNIACTTCSESFCPQHREPVSHICSPDASLLQPVKNQAARALLEKNFPSASKASAKQYSKKTVASRKLQLIKLRQRAIPLDPKNQKTTVPADRRRFFQVSIDGRGPATDYWVEKDILTGKAFDFLVNRFGISIAQMSNYQLYQSADNDHRKRLEYDKTLGEQIEDGQELTISTYRTA